MATKCTSSKYKDGEVGILQLVAIYGSRTTAYEQPSMCRVPADAACVSGRAVDGGMIAPIVAGCTRCLALLIYPTALGSQDSAEPIHDHHRHQTLSMHYPRQVKPRELRVGH